MAMKTIGIFEAKTRLSEVCEEVARTGEVTEISRRGKPLVRIVPLPKLRGPRSEIWEAVEAWDAAHPERDEDFELPPRTSTDRDALTNYWED